MREEAAAADPVLSAMSGPAPRGQVVNETLKALAEEAASLKFDRIQAEREGREIVGQLCSRRVQALSQLASLVVERARVGGQPDFDPRDQRVQKIVRAFFDQLAECARETLGTHAEKFLARFEEQSRGWENRL